MIPRLRPFFGMDDLAAALRASEDALPQLEAALAATLGFKHALLLSLGRTAIHLYLNDLGAKDREVVVAVYNCRVVPSTVVYSGAVPVYVDAALEGYNVESADVIAATTQNTAAIILTAMYGYPFSQQDVVAIRSAHPHVRLIGDCALALFSRPADGYYFADEMDLCLYAFGIGKQLSIVEGGVLTTNDAALYRRLKSVRDELLKPPPLAMTLKRSLLFLGATFLFHNRMYGLLRYLSEETSCLRSMKGSDTAISELMPQDWEFMPQSFQYGIGLNQLRKFVMNRENRAAVVDRYFQELSGIQGERFRLPPYFRYVSHFPVLSTDRDGLQQHLYEHGVHSTNVFRELPWDLPLVAATCRDEYPRARALRDQCTLLPLFADLDVASQNQVIKAIRSWTSRP